MRVSQLDTRGPCIFGKNKLFHIDLAVRSDDVTS
jgi:hypothetical protein